MSSRLWFCLSICRGGRKEEGRERRQGERKKLILLDSSSSFFPPSSIPLHGESEWEREVSHPILNRSLPVIFFTSPLLLSLALITRMLCRCRCFLPQCTGEDRFEGYTSIDIYI